MRHLLPPLLFAALSVDSCGNGSGITDHVGLGAGDYSTCARQSSSDVYCWGNVANVPLSTGSPLPTRVPGLTDVAEISVGGANVCARQTGGTVVCWGDNSYGQLGEPGRYGDVRSAPTHPVPGVQNVTQVVAYGDTTCVLQQGGVVSCWGDNTYGQLGDGNVTPRSMPAVVGGLTDVVELARGSANHVCARLRSGGVMCWGSGMDGELGSGYTRQLTPVAIPGITDAVEVVVSASTTCVRRASGSVVCSGLLASPVLTDAAELATGILHVCARRATGAVTCWGRNQRGVLGNPTVMDNQLGEVEVAGLTDAVEIAAGVYHTCARRATGAVVCWGDDEAGEIGDGMSGGVRAMPTPVMMLP